MAVANNITEQDPNRTTNVSYEYLVSIIAAIFVFVIASGFFSFAKEYPPQFVTLNTATATEQVQGYVRPGAVQSTPHAPSQTPGQADPNQQNLLRELTAEQQQRLQQRFDQAASLLHARQYEYAITALDQVIKIQPMLPEAYVNMGYAYLGLEQYETAATAFSRAIDLRPNQINAYYGLAESLEGMEDYEGALGAMRSYIHLSAPDDPYLAKARAAIWEWETKLGRKPQIEDQDKAITFDKKRFRSPH
ncbi:MAG: tetratricopeptide repeat protein [Gammaproteobacteria bacterium]|jgi:tetratricopeptide (TPR) repeat protein